MKKMLFVLLGLASLNVCVANPTYDATRGALQNDPWFMSIRIQS